MAENSLPPAKILILDDEKDFCELFKAQFEKRGFEVLVCFGAAEAFESIIKDKPQCLVLDIRLKQGEDGLTFLRKVRGFRSDDLELEDRIRRLPVVVLTSASPNMRSLFMTEGASEFIEKPYDAERVRVRILSLISLYSSAS